MSEPDVDTFKDRVILDYENYYLWRLHTEQKLAGASVLKYALGEVEYATSGPAAELAWMDEGRTKCIAIIAASLSSFKYGQYMDVVSKNDPALLWETINKEESKAGPTLSSKFRDEWDEIKYQPGAQTISEFVAKLQHLKLLVAGEEHRLMDEDELKRKLLRSLPRTEVWIPMTIALMGSDFSLGDTIRELCDYQLRCVPTAPAGNFADNRRGRRGRGRRGRRGRGGGYKGRDHKR